MKKERPKPPEDIAELLDLVEEGRLFSVQEWISTGRRIRPEDSSDFRFSVLIRAVESGFHSMVEVLLKAEGWGQAELDESIDLVMSSSRLDLVDLLLAHGASVKAIDFADVCRTVNPELMERFLREGVDPAKENAFARALDEIKARPLLRFYRSMRGEFPELDKQASLALARAVKDRKHRWTALLRWAGADPFMKVPDCLYDGDWDFGEYGGRIAAHEACWSKDLELLKVLALNPTPERLRELLDHSASFPSVPVFRFLLLKAPTGALNAGDPPSCKAVERLVSREFFRFTWSPRDPEPESIEATTCLEALLDAGGRWDPSPDEIGSARRSLSRNEPRHIVRVVRLLLYTPGSANRESLAELCRVPSIRAKIHAADPLLLDDLPRSVRRSS